MNEVDIVIWILTIAVLVCIGTICFMICVIAKLDSMVDVRDKSIDILINTARNDFKSVTEWQSKYMSVKEEYDRYRHEIENTMRIETHEHHSI